MSGWAQFNAANLFPAATQAVLTATGNVADATGQVLDVLATALETLSSLIIDIDDPIRPAIDLAIQNLKALVTNVENTGVYLYYDTTGLPFYKLRSFDQDEHARAMNIDESETARRQAASAAGTPYTFPELALEPHLLFGWTGWCKRFMDSLDDPGDDNKPDLADGSALTALLFVAGTPSLDDLPALLGALGQLFSIKKFNDLLGRLVNDVLKIDATAGDNHLTISDPTKAFTVDRFCMVGNLGTDWPEFVTPKSIDRSTGEFTLYEPLKNNWSAGDPIIMCGIDPQPHPASIEPDWRACQLKDFDPVRKITRVIRKLIGLMELAPQMSDMLQELADLLSEKAAQLIALKEQIEALIELIELILTVSGLYVLQINSTTGIQGLKDELEHFDRPPDLPDESHIIGVCMLGATADMGAVATLFGVT